MKPLALAILIWSFGVVPVSAAAPAAAPYVPTDAERARWTMSDMRSLATAIEAYAIDHKGSYPPAATLEDLVPVIQPFYVQKAPTTDAWGHPFVYVATPDRQSYRLVSAGSDGKTDPADWGTKGPLSSFDVDAVVEAGKMTRPWPFR